MQALRKSSVQLPASFEAQAAPSTPDIDRPRLAGDYAAAASPALALRDHLAARLEELAQPVAAPAAAIAVPEPAKLPMPARLAVIVGLSVALWTPIWFAAAAIL